MSNGGEMSYLLACTSSDLFKAVAPVAGVLMKGLKDSCELNSPVPVFEIHGTADKISLFEGDLNNEEGWGAYYDLPSTIDFFAERYQLVNKFKFACLIASVSCINLVKEVPHDYGDPAAISAQHAYTMDWAAGKEAARVAAVNAQQASDVWRGQGAKIAWGPSYAQKQGINDESYDSHFDTLAGNIKSTHDTAQSQRKNAVSRESDSNIWRGVRSAKIFDSSPR
jgi:hypothetical protein